MVKCNKMSIHKCNKNISPCSNRRKTEFAHKYFFLFFTFTNSMQIVNKLNAKTYIYLIIKNNIDFSICITPKVPVMGNLFYLTDYLIP